MLSTVDIPTPFLLIDGAIARLNIAKLSEYAAKHRLGVRPHTKTHKSLFIAGLQESAGAIGLTAAKVGEAEVMATVHDDILLAYPAADSARAQRCAALAQRAILRVAIDTTFAAEALGSAARSAGSIIGILVDLDVGMHRTGVASPQLARDLARVVSRTNGLRLDGLFIYPGHVRSLPEQQGDEMRAVQNLAAEALDLFGRDGLETKIVSSGSTPSAFQSHLVPAVTEIRPGTYVYNDMNTVRGGHCSLDDCAAKIIATVVSDAVPGKVIVDAGSKTLTQDLCNGSLDAGFGYVVEYPEAKITRLTEEHGELDVTKSPRRPRVGERVSIIPNHICPAVNLQDRVHVIDGDSITAIAVDTRGMLT